MFQKKSNTMARSNGTDYKPNTIVTGTTIKGDIVSEGDFRIDGKLTGSITSKGKIVVGQSGSIDGEITCQNADISGIIKAKLNVEQLLTLKSSANLSGDVITGKLAIEPGAKFTGTCNMSGGNTFDKQIGSANDGKQGSKEKQLK
ncbi:MAG: polymer-forming cytoskeletal protein [Bacteroidetes bacterium]|nr:MAG: polymer-forming cytoskeletal protein [Bacteroidota bacterium]